MLPEDLSAQFLSWQCRLRQIAMRDDEGRPSQGMRPKVLDAKGKEILDSIVVLIVRKQPGESTEFFKFQVQKQNDPQDIYKKGLIYLQATHYHRAVEFDDEMCGLFSPGSAQAQQLLQANACMLEFAQFNQKYKLPCTIRQLTNSEPAFEAALWHNRLFNPNLSNDVEIVGFKPDWEKAVKLLD